MVERTESEREVPEKKIGPEDSSSHREQGLPDFDTENEESSSAEDVVSSFESTAQEAVETVYNYARNVPAETVAYVVLALGLIVLPFHHLWGGTLIGLIVGVYFCEEIVLGARSLRKYIETTGRTKSIVLGGTFLALLIVLPTLFLGAAAATGIFSMLRSQKKIDAPTSNLPKPKDPTSNSPAANLPSPKDPKEQSKRQHDV